jgi:hypothetical protein
MDLRDKVIADDEYVTWVARRRIRAPSDALDIQVSRDGVEECRAETAVSNIQLTGRERRDHVLGRLKLEFLDLDSGICEVTLVQPDLSHRVDASQPSDTYRGGAAGIGRRAQLATAQRHADRGQRGRQ